MRKNFVHWIKGCMPIGMLTAAGYLLAMHCASAPVMGQTRVVNAAVGYCMTQSGTIGITGVPRVATGVCNADSNTQIFTRTSISELRIGSLCIEAIGGARNGGDIGMKPCNGTPSQRWTPQAGLLITTGATQQYCMAVDAASTAVNTRLITYDCVNHPSQKWAEPGPFPTINYKAVALVNSLGGKCLDVEGGSTKSNTRLIGYPCQPGVNQWFKFMPNGQLQDRAGSNQCLDQQKDLFGNITGAVAIQPCQSSLPANQRWRLRADGTIRNGNGFCMELQGGQRQWYQAGLTVINWQQAVVIANCNGSGEQNWKAGVLYSPSSYFGAIGQIASGGTGLIANVNTTYGASIVAGGSGNIVATDGATMVPLSIAQIVAAGGGNIIAAGGGNIIAAGGGNIIAAGGGNITGGN